MAPSRASRPPVIWQSAPLRLLLAVFPLWSITAVLIFHTTWQLKLAVGGVAGLTAAAPAAGLLTVAGLSPIAAAIAASIRMQQYRLSEMLVMAFLAAWLLRAGADRNGPRVPAVMTAAGWLLAAVLITSISSLAWRMRAFPADMADTLARLRGAYFLFPDRIGFVDGGRIIEGLGLAAATVHIFRRRPSLAVSLPVALCIGGAAASIVTVLVSRGTGPPALLDAFRMLGRPAHIFDVNAAGSYFAMVLALAIGMTARTRGILQARWIGLAVVIGVGLWFTESRSAMAAIVITGTSVVIWLVTKAWSARVRGAALAIVIAVGLGGSLIRARLLERDPTFHGGGFRQQFYSTSLRMIAARPFSGVGIGQYQRASALFLTPELAWTYGTENAHNYFLQIAGELGLPGFAFFMIWIGAALGIMARSLEHRNDPRLLGAFAGIVALLMTCITGHPLLVGEVTFPFWIQCGLALALAVSPLLNAAIDTTGAEHRDMSTARHGSRLWMATACAGGFVVLGALVSASAGPVRPPESQAVDGFYPWEAAEDGRKVRWTGKYGSVFVPAEIKRVYIPVRVPIDSPAITPMPVDIVISGQRHGRVLVDRNWGTLDLWLPAVRPPARFNRIDFRVERTWQPALYIAGSYDMRPVGVQVGECELVR